MIKVTYHPTRITLCDDVLCDLLREDVEVIGYALGVLRLFEMSRRARTELEAGGKTLQTKHVFQGEQRTGFCVVDHDQFGKRPPMHST